MHAPPYAEAILAQFLVGTTEVGYRIGVPSVWPSGTTVTITGAATTGLATTGATLPPVQFGTPTTRLGGPPQTVVVIGLNSAQAFGAIQVAQGRPVSAVNSAQAFGVPAPKAVFRLAVGSVSTAQTFGTPTIKTVVQTGAGGVPSAQAFGSVTVHTQIRVTPTSVTSAQSFGAIVTRTGFSQAVPGLGSAQAFGVPHPTWPQWLTVAALGSAQSFGSPTITGAIKTPSLGVPSAQAFGVPWIRFAQHATPPGLDSAQQFGTFFFVGTKWLWDLHCTGTPFASITDPTTICGTGHVCGGYSFNPEYDTCYGSPAPALLDQFLCGNAVVGGPGFTPELDCIEPQDAITGIPICGDGHVCGGLGFLNSFLCIDSGPILNTFLCGQRTIGQQHIESLPPAYVLDLDPVECA